jgi:uncharacterized protein involved in response to NO
MLGSEVLAMLLAAPHRGLFATAMAQGLLVMAWWTADLAGRYGGLWPTWPPPLPPAWLHALSLIHGVFACFIFGFILTAGPRWQQRPDTPPAVYRPVALLLASGWLLADVGLLLPALLPIGFLLALAGWSVLWRLALTGQRDRRHILAMALAQTAGALSLLTFALLTAGGPAWLGPWAITLGLWAYLLPVFLIVSHRMLPFFSQSIIAGFAAPRPYWTLYLMLLGSLLIWDLPHGPGWPMCRRRSPPCT